MKQSFYATGMLLLLVSTAAIAQRSETAFIARATEGTALLSRPEDPVVTEKVNVPMITTDNFKKEFRNVQERIIGNL